MTDDADFLRWKRRANRERSRGFETEIGSEDGRGGFWVLEGVFVLVLVGGPSMMMLAAATVRVVVAVP